MRKSLAKGEELTAFRLWIKSLSSDDLVRAMQYTFIKDANDDAVEFDLLKQMVEDQPPCPVPIHPKALGYHPFATKFGATDGRNADQLTLKNRFTRPRLFQLTELKSSGLKKKQSRIRRYDVITRKKVTPAGDVLGLGSTQEQRDADAWIMKGTHLYRYRRCCFSSASSSSAEEIRWMLNIVSRGNFLQQVLPASQVEECIMWTSWLKPTDRWFSLPMYLASRYEVALWSSFRGKLLPPLLTPTSDAAKHLGEEAMRVVRHMAMVKAMKGTVLPRDRDEFPKFRDGILYHLLEESSEVLQMNVLDLTPLLELGSTRDTFRACIVPYLEEELAKNLEESLLSLDVKETTSKKTSASKRKIGKKKKNKKKHKLPAKVDNAAAGDEVADNTHQLSSDLHVRFEDSGPPSLERTRKILLVMSVIEDIVEGVFMEVGLPPTPPFFDATPFEKKAISMQYLNNRSLRDAKEDFNQPSTDPFLSSDPSLPLQSQKVPDPISRRDVMSMLDSKLEKTNANPFYNRNALDLHGLNHATPIEVSWTFEDDRLDRLMNYQSREKSVFADFFERDESATASGNNQVQLASSTAASIASSTDKECEVVGGPGIDASDDQDALLEESPTRIPDEDDESLEIVLSHAVDLTAAKAHSSSPNLELGRFVMTEDNRSHSVGKLDRPLESPSLSPPLLQSPEPPGTPSPQLSPILVSLADLKSMRDRAPSADRDRATSEFQKKSYSAGSLPSSPVQNASTSLPQSWSRDDLRIFSFTDDQLTRVANRRKSARRYDSIISYRDAAIKPTSKSSTKGKLIGTLGYESLVPTRGLYIPYLEGDAPEKDFDACVRSEIAVEEQWHTSAIRSTGGHAHVENITTTKDESTTVSALSPREPDEFLALRDQRNTFRDMCLTLGAEVAKLKNLLSAQNGTHMQHHGHDYYAAHAPVYNPEFMRPFAYGIVKATTTIGAMSDAGVHRCDHDSAMSEEFEHTIQDSSGKAYSLQARRLSGGHTAAGSDISLDQNIGTHHAMPNIEPFQFEVVGSDLEAGAHSRLTKDISKFLEANTQQLQKMSGRRTSAMQRLSRLVTALWPRAQVKLYGSHVTGLSLPSSDLDFVVCLPAVHKNAPAITPGALEGRNAVNESSQKLLARKLKGESWIDPRSIRLIERTVVPIIKVSTKDTRARMQHLDISFDGPIHHGLEAIEMVNDILQELPLVRPLVLVLKQFLLDRGLLIAYTGGLSSYCLFLMVTRYLQEQPFSWGDCGALLMGFLDFYGNAFDPRATGISVRRRLYFGRRAPSVPTKMFQPAILAPNAASASPTLASGKPDFLRRHSVTDKGSLDSNWNRPPRHLSPAHAHAPPPLTHARFPHPAYAGNTNADSGMPYTFDPLWVEDPLAAGNNVGRNAFRIFQVQRAFSDAHRALVASLEWENGSNEEVEDYPLLKCMLQREDGFHDL